MTGIQMSVGAAVASSVQGNTITGISRTGTGVAGTFMFIGINAANGSIDVGTVTPNIIGGGTGTGAITVNNSISVSTTVGGIIVGVVTPCVVRVKNNIIGSISAISSGSTIAAGISGIQVTGTGIDTISGNIIGSNTTANSINAPTVVTGSGISVQVIGIISAATGVNLYISGNTVANLNSAANAPTNLHLMCGIIQQGAGFATVVTGNSVHDLYSSCSNTTFTGGLGGLTGIALASGVNCALTNNTVNALVNNNTAAVNSAVVGFAISGTTTSMVNNNRVYDLRNANTGTTATAPPMVLGINVGNNTTNVTVNNNMVSLGTAETTNTSFVGIQNSASSASNFFCYYNSVHIAGTVTAGALASAGFHRGSFAGALTTPVDIRNNVFNNTRTGGTGKHYAIANGIGATGTNTGWAANASNYNILNSPVASTVGFWGAADQTLTNWRTAGAASSDINSFTTSTVTFANAATGDLHINMGVIANNMESHGIAISGFATDYDNQARPGPAGSVNGFGTAPDMGADEFDGVATDNIPPIITYTVPLSGCGTANRVFTVNIVDNAGVPTSGGFMPRVWYRKNALAWENAAGALVSGTGLNGIWSFTIAPTGGVVLTDVVQFYVIAQDVNGFITSNPATGLVATNVNSVTTPPTTPNSYTIIPTVITPANVGTGGDYTTITSAVAAYNTGCFSGPVVFNLISPAYASETFPITISPSIYPVQAEPPFSRLMVVTISS